MPDQETSTSQPERRRPSRGFLLAVAVISGLAVFILLLCLAVPGLPNQGGLPTSLFSRLAALLVFWPILLAIAPSRLPSFMAAVFTLGCEAMTVLWPIALIALWTKGALLVLHKLFPKAPAQTTAERTAP